MRRERKILLADSMLAVAIAVLLLSRSMENFSIAVGKEGALTMAEAKKVALTFDDGPNPDYTEILLEGLEQRDVKATFFLLGEEAEKYPEIVEQIHEKGHMIGVHSYEHVNLAGLSEAAAMEQVNKTNDIIEKLTGERAEFIRPPYGCWKEGLDKKTSMIEVLWDIDPRDWATTNAQAVAERIITKVQENDIILLHDASKSSVEAALLVVDALQKQGYVFVTVEDVVLE